jgi:signal transduction histidine kinase
MQNTTHNTTKLFSFDHRDDPPKAKADEIDDGNPPYQRYDARQCILCGSFLEVDLCSRVAAITRITNEVAHEIKNPLNAIVLHLEALKSKVDPAIPEIDVIGREIRRLDHIVKTFLNYNRPIELKTSPVDLSEVIQEVLALMALDAKRKNITLETSIGRDAWISGDRDLLKQAILNVVVNAVEAMDGGGRLTVRNERAGEDWQISISDSGPGIPPEHQTKIFNLYFTTKEGGSGIGLAMSFRVVQLHGGMIDFASQSGAGATFRLRFPKLMSSETATLSQAQGQS